MHSLSSKDIVKIIPTHIFIIVIKKAHHVRVMEGMITHPDCGVDDDCNILGLEKDFQLVDYDKDPEDDFTRKLEDTLIKKMETEGTLNGKWNISWLGEEKRVCRLVTVSQVEAAVWTITEKGKIYYLRRSNATVKIDSGLELSKELKKFNQ